MRNVPKYVRSVLNTLTNCDYMACLVGGCLRDSLLKRPVHDWDVATSAITEDVARLFPKTVLTGARFGTVTVVTEEGNVEVTTFRSDGTYSDGRRPDEVSFVSDLRQDLQRRDFTMNAMAMTPDGVIIDPFDGQADINRRLIRCVGIPEERFSEDALRMFRALRFSAQLSFEVENKTLAAIKKCAPLCRALSAERIRDETEKILMSAAPEIASDALCFGLFDAWLTRPDKSLKKFENIKQLEKSALLRWSAFCAVLLSEGLIDSAELFLREMRLDTKTVKAAHAGVTVALSGSFPTERTRIKHLLAEKGRDAALCAAAADVVLREGEAIARVTGILKSGECFTLKCLAVRGDDIIELGFNTNEELGNVLKSLLWHVIEHPADNQREVLLRMAKEMQ